ncbi:MAG TPA: hypothetical protein VIX17_05605 [Pyrinomonadaceae bacterium]
MERKTSKHADLQDSVWTPRTFLWLALIFLFITLLFWSLYKFRSAKTGPFRTEYEGRIIDKWANHTQSEQGAQPYFRLVINGNDNQRFTVAVSSEIYDRAKVGMSVRKTDAGIEFITDESNINR